MREKFVLENELKQVKAKLAGETVRRKLKTEKRQNRKEKSFVLEDELKR